MVNQHIHTHTYAAFFFSLCIHVCAYDTACYVFSHVMHICRFILKESGFPRYLHSAALLSGTLLIFGGNTHNDTSLSNGAKCFSADFLAYDIGKTILDIVIVEFEWWPFQWFYQQLEYCLLKTLSCHYVNTFIVCKKKKLSESQCFKCFRTLCVILYKNNINVFLW